MDITPTTIIIVGVVCVVLGFLASVLLNTLSEENEPAAGVDEAPPGGRKGRYTPVVRVWRERGSGTLVVEMDGKSFLAPDPLNEAQRERLEKSARDLRAWLGMGLARAESPEPARPATTSQPPAAKEEAASRQEADLPELPEEDEIDLGRALGLGTSTTAVKSTAATPPPPPARKAPAPTRVPTPPPPPAPKGVEEPVPASQARSIVMQIEDILQDMVAGTPLEQRSIHLLEDPTRGVIVQVGIKNYEGIDSVPDPEVKRVIQEAVQEWEKGQ